MLLTLVTFHEAGHFAVARWNKVRVIEFAIGFGPKLMGWTSARSGTRYVINCFPLGGYCAMQGENQLRSSQADTQLAVAAPPPCAEDDYDQKGPWQRLSIIVAGPIANFILAYVILLGGALFVGVMTNTYGTRVASVAQGSVSETIGLRAGDELVGINGHRIANPDQIVAKIRSSPGVPLRILYTHNGATHDVRVIPQPIVQDGKTIGQIGFVRTPNFQRLGPMSAIPAVTQEFSDAITTQAAGVMHILSQPMKYGDQLSGPIGIARTATIVQDIGLGAYLQLFAVISIGLAVFNLLPFPALDGGRAIFVIIELIRGKPIDRTKEAYVHAGGLVALMGLMLFTTYHDISNIVLHKAAF